MTTHRALPEGSWWRDAVVYQIYPRSFADGNGDGTGDVVGIISRLDHLADLGIDAIWISPWYPSPLADGGYDVADYRDIDPRFGTLDQADELIAAAHERGLRVIIDLVPNHSSDEHVSFQQALAAGPGSPERDRYIFCDGRGENGELPPNNWRAMFGGPAWERVVDTDGNPEQWYLHMFDIKQPDWNWENPEVVAEFDDVLRFWFDRGVDGFRVDVADSMGKADGLPDVDLDDEGLPSLAKYPGSPMWDQPILERIQRRWRAIADEYAESELGPRVFVSEAYLSPAPRLAAYVAPGRLHTTFNFDALLCEWTATSQRNVIANALAAHEEVGAACTWVLGNHDNVRVVSRFGKPITGVPFDAEGAAVPVPGFNKDDTGHLPTDLVVGRRRARAAALLELALPGGAYIYQGEELGLDEVEDLPESALQDPTWERSEHTIRGRDGCRVPIPWSGDRPPFGFSSEPVTAEPWLPMPDWSAHSVEAQEADDSSFLWLYRRALAERRHNPALGDGTLTWNDSDADVLDFSREPGFRCIVNFGAPIDLPPGEVILVSGPLADGRLGSDQAVWLRTG